jgi:hypothetical protein
MEHAENFEQKINTNIVGSSADLNFSIADLKRRIDWQQARKKLI